MAKILKFITLRAIATAKGRVSKGTVIALTAIEAKRYGSMIEKTDAELTDERFINSVNGEPTATESLSGDADDTSDNDSSDDDADDESGDGLDDMSSDELKAKAKALELPTSGNKAAIIERIRLAEQANDDSDDSTDDE